MTFTKAAIDILSPEGRPPIEVQFNPTDLSTERGAQWADVEIPGLAMPLLQFVRGTSHTLNVTLLLDGPQVRERLDALRGLITIDGTTHAPPVVRFSWGDTSFKGVVTTFNEQFTLFTPEGDYRRARVTLALKAFRAPGEDWNETPRESPDVIKTHVVREGDRIDAIAAREYGRASAWRVIAEYNDLERPRTLTPGTVLELPPI